MDTVAIIFAALGGTKAIAADIGVPYQTVYSWKAKNYIPGWRRPAIAEMARRRQKRLPDDAAIYLAVAPAEAE